MDYTIPIWIVGSVVLLIVAVVILFALIIEHDDEGAARRDEAQHWIHELDQQRAKTEAEAARLRGLMAISQNARRLH